MNRASNMKEKLDKALSKHYYNAKTVGSFGGIHNLSKTSKKNRETVISVTDKSGPLFGYIQLGSSGILS